jgi:hypothetical protein
MSLKLSSRVLFALGALAALPLALSGCCFFEDDGEAVSESASPILPINEPFPPPANEPEIIPAIPNPMVELWRPGYWAPGENGGFAWVPGQIIIRPSPTAVWASARWVRHTYGWAFEQGHWQ